MKFGISAVILTVINFISRILGYVRDIFLAFFLGTNIYSDIYAICCRIPFFFRSVFFEGTFNSSYIPIVNSIEDKNKRKIFTFQLLIIFIVIFLPVIILFEVFTPNIISIFAPGFISNPEYELSILVARISFPYLIFVVLTSFLIAVLNRNFFFISASLVHILLNLTLIFVLILSLSSKHHAIIYIAWGLIISGILQTAFLYFNVKNEFNLISFGKIFMKEKIIDFFILFWPGIIIYGLAHFNRYIGYWFASFEDGVLSYLYYAERLFYIPITIISVSIFTVLLPYISKNMEINNYKKALYYQRMAFKYTLLFILPAGFGIFFLAENIIEFIFQRGVFNEISTLNTSIILKAFSFGIPANALVLILLPYFFSSKKLKNIFIYTLIVFLLNIIIIYSLINKYGFIVIPSSYSFTSWLFAILLFISMSQQKFIIFDRVIYKNVFLYLFCSIIISLLIVIIKILSRNFDLPNILQLSISIISSIFVYFLLVMFFDKKTYRDFYLLFFNKTIK